MSGELRDKGISSSNEAKRMVRQCCEASYIQNPAGTILAETTKWSPPMVSKVWNNTGYEKVENKESALLTMEQEQSLVQRMLNIIDTTGFITTLEIRTEASRIAGCDVGHCWHVNLLKRHEDEFGILETKAGEESRIKIEESGIIYYQELLQEELKGIPVELNANADEVVGRGEKRVSVMAGAAQSSEFMLPFIIQRQPIDHFAHLLIGTRQGKYAYIAESEGSNMTNPLFNEWLLNCAVPFYVQMRQKIGATLATLGAQQVDNSTSHLSENPRLICALSNIKLITLPLNTTQYLQSFDLGIFSSFKSHLQSLRRHNTNDTKEQIIHVAIPGRYQALAPVNILYSFEQAGQQRQVKSDGRAYCKNQQRHIQRNH
ncbi:MAG: hypothetical protein EZS28_026126 [Streblomastix strix]|uniref:DDE-1 domain-containing protein n=1 Tax=Streblomastix strix TaxID=222440 RepID=A0A5J4V6G0_9EUKA|nr:MAG: hypothetical protein EZS28_026126 [Streblomastix strix]